MPYLYSPSSSLYKNTFMIFIKKGDSRVKDFLFIAHFWLPGTNFYLINLSVWLLENDLECWTVAWLRGKKCVSSKDKDKISILCFKNAWVKVE